VLLNLMSNALEYGGTTRPIELMDGSIEAESELGSGTTFIISLPRPQRLEAISEPASPIAGTVSS
jgi:hypothetical protein